MDATLRAILAELFSYSQTIDALEKRVAALEAEIEAAKEHDHAAAVLP